MRLFHFSEDPTIARFDPRPVRVPVDRPRGQEWLNGPLVWAIDEPHSFLYLFPRECPRILLWATPATTAADRERWLGNTTARAIAYIESGWSNRLAATAIHRYEFAPETFEDVRDVGMWVSRAGVAPVRVDCLTDLPDRLIEQNVQLRVVDRLTPLKGAWDTTVHASGIRLRSAIDWGPPGWPHTPPPVLMSIRKAEPADTDRIADLIVRSASGTLPTTRAAIAAEIGRDIDASNGELKWIVTEVPDDTTAARIAVIPPPPIYDLKGGRAGIVLGAWATPGTTLDLRPFEQHLRDRGAAMLVVSCDASDAARRKQLEALGYTATTHFILKPELKPVSPNASIRPATEADIPALVAFNREARERLHEANPAFWISHPDAEARFALWMKVSLALPDRTIFVSEHDNQPTGFAIAQPPSPIQVPIALDESKIGVIDDFHCASFGRALHGGRDDGAGCQLLRAAESEFLRRGKTAAIAICPAAWPAKAALLQSEGYATLHTWLTRPV